MMAKNTATRRFLAQRLTAVLLIPLGLWFIISIKGIRSYDLPSLLSWMQLPQTTLLLILFSLSLFYHANLGLRTILEDYAANIRLRQAAITTSRYLFVGCAVFSMLFILLIYIH